MRKALLILLCALLCILPSLAGAADRVSESNETTGYQIVIEDNAGLLDAAEMTDILLAMREVSEYANVGLLTYPEGGGSNAASATKAKEWGNSVFGATKRFTVFIIDMRARHLDIYASQPLAGTLTAAEENSIADNVYKLASAREYGKCARETFTQIAKVLRGEKIATPMKIISNVFTALIAAILLAYILISGWARKEQAVSMPVVVKAAVAGGATVVLGNTLKRVVHHESSSGHGGGGHGGGGGGGGGGGSSGGHGF